MRESKIISITALPKGYYVRTPIYDENCNVDKNKMGLDTLLAIALHENGDTSLLALEVDDLYSYSCCGYPSGVCDEKGDSVSLIVPYQNNEFKE